MLKKVFYGLLSLLLVILILEHFFMSAVFHSAFQQLSGRKTSPSTYERVESSNSEDHAPEGNDEEDDYTLKLKNIEHVPNVYKKAIKELRELDSSPGFSPQASEIRTYLDWLFSVPWGKNDETSVDLEKAKKILDRDHKGLEKVKEHILEYLAVKKRVPNGKAPIICFTGPPGVGKTTLAKSIAEATGRKFVRISLGGVGDESNIRGFLRTYIASKPGEIVKALIEANSSNPVILLDEIDKLGSDGHRGNPAAALLEVLDPSQNKTFKDHYLDMGVDLSQVIFIATSNSMDIPPALMDRLEIIEVPSYTQEEKVGIAKEHLLPKQLKENGIQAGEFAVSDDTIRKLIKEYTMEAGVRQLDRAIANLCRKALKSFYDGKSKTVSLTPESLVDYLGKPLVHDQKAMKKDIVGATHGLAWSPVGGSIATFEAVLIPGEGRLVKTGNLGEMSQESIMAAMTVAKSMLPSYGIKSNFLDDKDMHIHAAGGGKKDGPSAGITITTAMVSAITNIPVNKDVCMTGEINLHGDVLPIGGLKEKLIAAHNLGLKIAIIPMDNASDLDEVPQNVKDEMKIYTVSHIREVLKIALAKSGRNDVDAS
ncbi:MAG: endopeptidase La [Alphaproteobacteria bacterium]|nr:endopeptidase La [Alphaproteobacteria bacterium]